MRLNSVGGRRAVGENVSPLLYLVIGSLRVSMRACKNMCVYICVRYVKDQGMLIIMDNVDVRRTAVAKSWLPCACA